MHYEDELPIAQIPSDKKGMSSARNKIFALSSLLFFIVGYGVTHLLSGGLIYGFAAALLFVAIFSIITWIRPIFLESAFVPYKKYGTTFYPYSGITKIEISQSIIQKYLGLSSIFVSCDNVRFSSAALYRKPEYSFVFSHLTDPQVNFLYEFLVKERDKSRQHKDLTQNEKDDIQLKKSVVLVAKNDVKNWFKVLFLTGLAPLILLSFIPYLKFNSSGKNILFFFIPPLLTFLSYKYWRVFYTSEPRSPQIAYLKVYSIALICVIYFLYFI